MVGPLVGDLTGLSQYPVFKVQAQRDTLRSLNPTVNKLLRAALAVDPALSNKNAPGLSGGVRRAISPSRM